MSGIEKLEETIEKLEKAHEQLREEIRLAHQATKDAREARRELRAATSRAMKSVETLAKVDAQVYAEEYLKPAIHDVFRDWWAHSGEAWIERNGEKLVEHRVEEMIEKLTRDTAAIVNAAGF